MIKTLKKGLITGLLGVAGCTMLAASAEETGTQQMQGGNAQWKNPISNPIFNDTAELKRQFDFQFIWQSLASHFRTIHGPILKVGVDMNVGLFQLEYPISERWALLINKAGYIDFNPSGTLMNKREGFANISGGVKYALPSAQIEPLNCAVRTTIEAPTGDDQVFQDGRGSISPAFIATYDFDRIALNGVAGAILPFDGSEQSSKGYMSFDFAAKLTRSVSSHVELNWFRVLDTGNGDAVYDSHGEIQTASHPSVGFEGGDLFNLGAENADKFPDLVTGALGLRYQALENVSLGMAYEIAMTHTHKEQSFMDERVTANVSMQF